MNIKLCFSLKKGELANERNQYIHNLKLSGIKSKEEDDMFIW
jgi:hypothetical protein